MARVIAFPSVEKTISKFLNLSVSVALSVVLTSSVYAEQLPDIEFYQNDNVTNQIPYFDNRFRIDAQLEEITLIFYRKSGTPPVILVKPDGTKLKVNNLNSEEFEWYDDRTFDMIKLKKPMPGPWQAIGEILPESKIMVVSEVKLQVDPFADVLLEGETLKVTGRLLNGERAIDEKEFREVIQLDVDFFSTNNSIFDNFGAEPIRLDSFRDDGYDLDEYAGDGVFTGEFELDFAPGEWQPIYIVKMPMATRKLQQKPIIIRPSPIKISIEKTTDVNGDHILHFDIDPTYVDPNSIVMQGKITFPDRQEKPFSIIEENGGEHRKIKIGYTEGGIHRIGTGVFGKTIEGREFRLVLTEFTFNIDRQELVTGDLGLSPEEIAAKREQEKADRAAERVRALKEAKAKKAAEEAEKQQQMYLMIGIGNLAIVIIGVVVFLMLRRKKK